MKSTWTPTEQLAHDKQLIRDLQVSIHDKPPDDGIWIHLDLFYRLQSERTTAANRLTELLDLDPFTLERKA